jgi:hypothetical protein
MPDMNPRVLRTQLVPYVGKKVMIGTTDLHYVSGVIESIEGSSINMKVAGRPVVVPAKIVATIREAPAHEAEYVK